MWFSNKPNSSLKPGTCLQSFPICSILFHHPTHSQIPLPTRGGFGEGGHLAIRRSYVLPGVLLDSLRAVQRHHRPRQSPQRSCLLPPDRSLELLRGIHSINRLAARSRPFQVFFLSLSPFQTSLGRPAHRARVLHAVLAHDAGGLAGAGGVAAVPTRPARPLASLRPQAARPADAQRLRSLLQQRSRGAGAAEARGGGPARQAARCAIPLFRGPDQPSTLGGQVHVAHPRASRAPVHQEDRHGGLGDAVDRLLLPADLEVPRLLGGSPGDCRCFRTRWWR